MLLPSLFINHKKNINLKDNYLNDHLIKCYNLPSYINESIFDFFLHLQNDESFEIKKVIKPINEETNFYPWKIICNENFANFLLKKKRALVFNDSLNNKIFIKLSFKKKNNNENVNEDFFKNDETLIKQNNILELKDKKSEEKIFDLNNSCNENKINLNNENEKNQELKFQRCSENSEESFHEIINEEKKNEERDINKIEIEDSQIYTKEKDKNINELEYYEYSDDNNDEYYDDDEDQNYYYDDDDDESFNEIDYKSFYDDDSEDNSEDHDNIFNSEYDIKRNDEKKNLVNNKLLEENNVKEFPDLNIYESYKNEKNNKNHNISNIDIKNNYLLNYCDNNSNNNNTLKDIDDNKINNENLLSNSHSLFVIDKKETNNSIINISNFNKKQKCIINLNDHLSSEKSLSSLNYKINNSKKFLNQEQNENLNNFNPNNKIMYTNNIEINDVKKESNSYTNTSDTKSGSEVKSNYSSMKIYDLNICNSKSNIFNKDDKNFINESEECEKNYYVKKECSLKIFTYKEKQDLQKINKNKIKNTFELHGFEDMSNGENIFIENMNRKKRKRKNQYVNKFFIYFYKGSIDEIIDDIREEDKNKISSNIQIKKENNKICLNDDNIDNKNDTVKDSYLIKQEQEIQVDKKKKEKDLQKQRVDNEKDDLYNIVKEEEEEEKEKEKDKNSEKKKDIESCIKHNNFSLNELNNYRKNECNNNKIKDVKIWPRHLYWKEISDEVKEKFCVVIKNKPPQWNEYELQEFLESQFSNKTFIPKFEYIFITKSFPTIATIAFKDEISKKKFLELQKLKLPSSQKNYNNDYNNYNNSSKYNNNYNINNSKFSNFLVIQEYMISNSSNYLNNKKNGYEKNESFFNFQLKKKNKNYEISNGESSNNIDVSLNKYKNYVFNTTSNLHSNNKKNIALHDKNNIYNKLNIYNKFSYN
ncbi:conserved Plasmodium protein, unknown function [Plasmodium gallinaceum]|uniref:Uncharacterized protein n=1 Tax=Plasmodium gallinaceum TaxID=5849 RepID=A0A1J1GR34_PLAGA|nr:conserved Plasmodium protein, unknown function [Plasmodium gallinaceum]CRG93498.1 conserved Plasmodium protein, unknown function [Plasmodium gallinaceum]